MFTRTYPGALVKDATLPLHFQAMCHLYRHAFSLYRPMYFLYKRISDRKKLSLLAHLVKPEMVVLDVGANIGFYTSVLSRHVGPVGHVHCFEPDQTNFTHLSRLASGHPNVTVSQCAVGVEGSARVLVRSSANIDHRLATVECAESEGGDLESVAVKVVSLDDYCDKLSRVDFVKMDIQGGEYEALQGMRRTLERSPGLVMIMEYWPYGLRRAGVEPGALLELIAQCGLCFEILDPQIRDIGRLEPSDPLGYTDLLLWNGRSREGSEAVGPLLASARSTR